MAIAAVLAALVSQLPDIARGSDLAFHRHVINGDSEYVAAAAIDVNRDGRLDVVCGSYWYEAPSWKRHHLREVEVYRGRPDGYSHLEVDVNRDGWTDIVTVNYRSRSLKWIEHPGETADEWTAHVIAEPGSSETGRLVDVDGDGILDVLPNGVDFAAWWSLSHEQGENGETPPVWTRHDFPKELAAHGLGCGDVDGDGRPDVVGRNGWASAPEFPRSQPWGFHDDFMLDRASVPILVVDVDDDGDNDLVWCRAHDFGAYWTEQQAVGPRRPRWTHHVIDSSWSGGHSPLWADMDGDGQGELVVGKRYLAHEGRDPGEYDPQYGYRYQFDRETRTWRRWELSVGEGVGYGLDPKAVDLDGDDDLDLLCGGRNGLYWLENKGAPTDKAVATQRDQREQPSYEEHPNLLVVKDDRGVARQAQSPFDWGRRRSHIVQSIEREIGPLPGPHARVPLDVESTADQTGDEFSRRTISFMVESGERAHAQLLLPRNTRRRSTPAVLIAATANVGVANDETTRVASVKSRLELAESLARRGFVCLVPSFANPAASAVGNGSSAQMRSVWRHIRAVDVLDSLEEVDQLRIGIVGRKSAGPVALLTAVFDQRLSAVAVDYAQLADAMGDIRLAEALATVASRPLLLHTESRNSEGAADQQLLETREAAEIARTVYTFRGVNSAMNVTDSATGDANRPAHWLVETLRP